MCLASAVGNNFNSSGSDGRIQKGNSDHEAANSGSEVVEISGRRRNFLQGANCAKFLREGLNSVFRDFPIGGCVVRETNCVRLEATEAIVNCEEVVEATAPLATRRFGGSTAINGATTVLGCPSYLTVVGRPQSGALHTSARACLGFGWTRTYLRPD